MGAMWKKRHMVYYVSAHGYGHGVRASDLIGGLLAVAPELRLTVISDLPEDFFRSRLPAADGRVAFAPGAFDVGMVQLQYFLQNIVGFMHANFISMFMQTAVCGCC